MEDIQFDIIGNKIIFNKTRKRQRPRKNHAKHT